MTDLATQKLLDESDPDQLIQRNNETKAFTFRSLPTALHITWKTCAAISGVSMEEFGVNAIKAAVKKVLSESQDNIKEMQS